jgi:uncharacterized protein
VALAKDSPGGSIPPTEAASAQQQADPGRKIGSRPHPHVTEWGRPFWSSIASHRLAIQHCANCGIWQHPPLPLCPACGSAGSLTWKEVSGTGWVYAFTVIHRPPLPVFEVPYVVALVELDDAPVRVLSNISRCDPAEVHHRQPVEIFYFEDDGFELFGFTPTAQTTSG